MSVDHSSQSTDQFRREYEQVVESYVRADMPFSSLVMKVRALEGVARKHEETFLAGRTNQEPEVRACVGWLLEQFSRATAPLVAIGSGERFADQETLRRIADACEEELSRGSSDGHRSQLFMVLDEVRFVSAREARRSAEALLCSVVEGRRKSPSSLFSSHDNEAKAAAAYLLDKLSRRLLAVGSLSEAITQAWHTVAMAPVSDAFTAMCGVSELSSDLHSALPHPQQHPGWDDVYYPDIEALHRKALTKLERDLKRLNELCVRISQALERVLTVAKEDIEHLADVALEDVVTVWVRTRLRHPMEKSLEFREYLIRKELVDLKAVAHMGYEADAAEHVAIGAVVKFIGRDGKTYFEPDVWLKLLMGNYRKDA